MQATEKKREAVQRALELAKKAKLRGLTNRLLNDPGNLHERVRYGNSLIPPLQIAVMRDNVELAKALIDAGADANDRYSRIYRPRGRPLEVAVKRGNIEMVDALIAGGADVNLWGTASHTYLYEAVCERNLTLVNILIAAGTEVNQGPDCLTEAVRRGNLAIVNTLIAAGANVNRRALNEAVHRSNSVIVETLIAKGADVNGPGLLAAATIKLDTDMVSLLINAGADVNKGDPLGVPLLRLAELCGTLDSSSTAKMVQLLLSAGADASTVSEGTKDTALMLFVKNSTDYIEPFLLAGVDVNSDCGCMLRMAALKGDEERVKLLLSKGADVNMARKFSKPTTNNYYGHAQKQQNGDIQDTNTALMNSVSFPNIVKMLIAAEADVNQMSSELNSPLILAAACCRESLEILLQAGADVNHRNAQGQTALLVAEERGIIEALLDSQADVNHVDFSGMSALMLAAYRGDTDLLDTLIARGAIVNKWNHMGNSALVEATKENKVECLRRLIDVGAPDTGELNMALVKAASLGHVSCVEELVIAGAEVNQPSGCFEDLPLRVATREGQTSCVRKLLAAGADVNFWPCTGERTGDFRRVVKYGYDDVAFLLLEAGTMFTAD